MYICNLIKKKNDLSFLNYWVRLLKELFQYEKNYPNTDLLLVRILDRALLILL